MRDRSRIAWAITGAGHNLEACADLLLKHKNVDIFLSRAAEEVVRIYSLEARLKASQARIYHERLSSAPLVVRLFRGDYKVLVIAPATSNSVAKFVCGISDTLVTNMFAQAGKSRVPIIVMPTDIAPDMDSIGPHREMVKVYPRPIDLENTARLRSFPGVAVVETMEEMQRCLATYL
jgi:dihydromethanopterin reductase (acceptor)